MTVVEPGVLVLVAALVEAAELGRGEAVVVGRGGSSLVAGGSVLVVHIGVGERVQVA